MIRHYRGSHAPLRAVRALSRRAQITIGAIMVALGLATGGLMAAPASATTTGAGVLNTAQTALLIGTTPANVVHSTLGAGYQANHNTFRYVAAQWTLPTINCSKWKPNEVVNFWVGLGPSDSKSERINIYGNCAGGTTFYTVDYYINNGPNRISAAYPGDKISASVYYDNKTGKVRFTMHDPTQNFSYNQEHSCAGSCVRSVAEVMAGPNGDGQLAPYGSVTFHSIAITSQSGQQGNFSSPYWNNTKIYEYDINDSTLLAAAPSVLSNSGTQFTDTWKNP